MKYKKNHSRQKMKDNLIWTETNSSNIYVQNDMRTPGLKVGYSLECQCL